MCVCVVLCVSVLCCVCVRVCACVCMYICLCVLCYALCVPPVCAVCVLFVGVDVIAGEVYGRLYLVAYDTVLMNTHTHTQILTTDAGSTHHKPCSRPDYATSQPSLFSCQ